VRLPAVTAPGAGFLQTQCLKQDEMIVALEPPIVYGAIDMDKFSKSIWGNAHPLSVGFRMCAEAVEAWLSTHTTETDDLGILIIDDTDNKDTKNAIRNAFKDCRSRVRSVEWENEARGQLKHLHDDLYFGDSACSCGIQAADICSYLINRHLNQRHPIRSDSFLYFLLQDRAIMRYGTTEQRQGAIG
jgi:Protein of unknown function (DUF3800)